MAVMCSFPTNPGCLPVTAPLHSALTPSQRDLVTLSPPLAEDWALASPQSLPGSLLP